MKRVSGKLEALSYAKIHIHFGQRRTFLRKAKSRGDATLTHLSTRTWKMARLGAPESGPRSTRAQFLCHDQIGAPRKIFSIYVLYFIMKNEK